jgi:hypothetical protein
MADDINKKISIDVEVNTDGQQQIDQYKASFDNLRGSISNLGKPITDLSNNVGSLSNNLSKLSPSGDKVAESISGLSEAFKLVNPLIDTVKKGFVSLVDGLSGGLAIFITFGPEIIKWAASLLKGKEAITQAKLSLDTLNKAFQSSDYSNAIQQMNELKINVGLAKKGFLDKKEVLEQYNNTLGKTMGKTNDLNKVESILVSKGGNYIKMTLLKAEAQLSLQSAAQNALEVEQEKLKSDSDVLTWWDKTVTVLKGIAYSSAGVDGFAVAAGEEALKAAERRKEATDDLEKQKQDYLAIAAKFEKEAAALAKKNGFDFFSGSMTSTRNTDTKPKIKQQDQPAPPPPIDKSLQTDPQPDAEDQAALNVTVISDAQKTSDALKQIESDRLVQQMKDDDAARAQKLAKEKQAAQQLKDFELQTAGQVSSAAFSILQNSIKQQTDAKLAALESQKNSELSNTNLTSAQKIAIEAQFKKKEDAVKLKAFKEEQEAALAQAVINGALAITKATSQTGVLSPLVILEIIAETAIEIAKITAEKPPAYASGGLHYASDGRGGVLPGYSRTDNTNAYLRSGEGIVVSEAMRAPWARNLVSAINVGFGGRDFSITNPGRGYAVGGIFTDGGNANRYYNAPVNDQKNLANTIAYQMINNFPPVYVDVKDINNQQNILAQTINRVNL